MITFEHKGDFTKTFDFLKRAQKIDLPDLAKFGEAGVRALQAATPVRSGLTASSWYYEIVYKDGEVSIEWLNSNVKDGVPIAVILQYGHMTGTGGWVQGIDYINPALKPIFEQIADNAWKELTRN